MVLSDELFAEVVGAVAVAGRDEPREQDRRRPRVRVSGELPVCFGTDLRAGPAAERGLRVRDLSAGGVGLLHDERVALDEPVVVHLPRAGGRTLPVLGRVVYWEPLAVGSYGIGVRFEQVLGEQTWAADAAAATAVAGVAPPAPRPGVVGRIVRAVTSALRPAA